MHLQYERPLALECGIDFSPVSHMHIVDFNFTALKLMVERSRTENKEAFGVRAVGENLRNPDFRAHKFPK